MYDPEWPLSNIIVFVADIRGITIYLHNLSTAMTTVTNNIKRNKQLSAHSISIEIYSGIARFPCDNTITCRLALQYNNYLQFRFLDCLVVSTHYAPTYSTDEHKTFKTFQWLLNLLQCLQSETGEMWTTLMLHTRPDSVNSDFGAL